MLRFSWLLPLVFVSAAAHAQPDRRTQALQLFEQSDKAYKAGKFEEAADLLRKAYAAYPEPILLYNLGRALEGLGDPQGAVEAYENYLHVAKKVDDRGAIERRIETLKNQLAKQAEADRPPPEPPLPAAAPPQPLPQPATPVEPVEELDVPATAGWVAIGTGGALLATGAFFGWRASANHDDAVNEPVQSKAADLQDTAHNDATLANVMLVAGGVIAIGGGVFELLHQRSQQEGPQISITPRSISVGWAW